MDWLISLLPWWAWTAAAILLVAAAWFFLGYKRALAVAVGLLALLSYGKGRRDSSKQDEQRADNIERKRQDAYDEIDRRNTTRSDAAERLRKGNY